MQRLTRSLSLTIAAVVFAACSSGSAPSVVPSAATGTVDGKTFVSTAVQGALLVPGTRIQLSFKDGRLNASGGCNAMSGPYRIAGDRLSAGQLATTEMGCDQARMQQDTWLARLLGGATATLAGDTLTLEDGTTRVTLLDREVASPDRPIEGTHWILDGIVSGDTASSVPAGVTASIQIAGGRVAVESGCNTGAGTVDVKPAALTFGPIGLTKRPCQAGSLAVEGALIGVLAKTVSYSIEADVLTIKAGNAGLTFRAAT